MVFDEVIVFTEALEVTEFFFYSKSVSIILFELGVFNYFIRMEFDVIVLYSLNNYGR